MENKYIIILIALIVSIIIVSIIIIGSNTTPKQSQINATVQPTPIIKSVTNPIQVNQSNQTIQTETNQTNKLSEEQLDSGCTTYCQSRPWASCYDSCIKSGSK